MHIILACFAGMSTSLLVKKVEDAAKKRSFDLTIQALPASSNPSDFESADIILLGPQARYMIEELQNNLPNIPIASIPMDTYGSMNGDKILDLALSIIQK